MDMARHGIYQHRWVQYHLFSNGVWIQTAVQPFHKQWSVCGVDRRRIPVHLFCRRHNDRCIGPDTHIHVEQW